jgi:predicted metal-dependent hydrolase
VKGLACSVRLTAGYFVVTLPDTGDRNTIRVLVEQWYRDHAEALIAERVRRALNVTTWLDVKTPQISIRVLKQRWGSTTKSGRVTFNVDLVKLPLPCIDYVVAHELVHVRIPNHSPAFWRMLSRVMPDWRRWRERLEGVEI